MNAQPILMRSALLIKRESAVIWPVCLQCPANRGKISDMTDINAAINALWLPFQTGAIAWSTSYLFLRARTGNFPEQVKPAQLECIQTFKPFSDQLERAGWHVGVDIEKKYPVVLLLPPPQRDETRALFALALESVEDDGVVVVSMQNNAGAKSGEADLRKLAPDLQSLSKSKCRVFWTRKRNIDQELMQSWLAFDQPRLIEATGLISRPGVFAWDRIDIASKLLSEYLPADLSGLGADLGAGTGFLAHFVLSHSESVKSMDVFEAEARSLECAKLNLAPFETRVGLRYFWHDVTNGIQGPYDFIISNPPFHLGREEARALGQSFIEVAAKAMKPGGGFYMVANRHLPYESILEKYYSKVSVLALQDGFKVFQAIK